MTAGAIRVVVADDHAVVREGLRRVLDAPGFAVIEEAADVSGALSAVERHRPDVLVLDIKMPGGSGLQIVGRVRDVSPSTRVLMLSVHDGPEYVLESVRQGAHGYVRKDSAPAELRAAVQAVHDGNAYFSPSVALHLTTALRSHGADVGWSGGERTGADRLATLTSREREVLRLVVGGKTNKQVAGALRISPRTVEAHRESLSRKLGIRSVAGLTRFALEAGVTLEAPNGS